MDNTNDENHLNFDYAPVLSNWALFTTVLQYHYMSIFIIINIVSWSVFFLLLLFLLIWPKSRALLGRLDLEHKSWCPWLLINPTNKRIACTPQINHLTKDGLPYWQIQFSERGSASSMKLTLQLPRTNELKYGVVLNPVLWASICLWASMYCNNNIIFPM